MIIVEFWIWMFRLDPYPTPYSKAEIENMLFKVKTNPFDARMRAGKEKIQTFLLIKDQVKGK